MIPGLSGVVVVSATTSTDKPSGGRYLFIVLDREYKDVFYVVMARDMTDREKGYYRTRRR